MTEQNNTKPATEKPHVKALEVIRNTAPIAIAELEFVKKKFIDNYNLAHKQKNGDLVYHRQLVHFKQTIAASDQLRAADPFSLYACFLTAAVNGDSMDPNDEETYLLAVGGKAVLWPQTKSLVKRLRNSGQVAHADQAQLVYQGDDFEVENGRVKKHVEKFASEIIVAGYVRFALDDKGTEKFFIYRKSDWEAWREKSTQKNGANWKTASGQPLAAFLRTKLIKHACKDKSWSSSTFHPGAEQFNIEIDDPAEVVTEDTAATEVTEPASFSPESEAAVEVTIVHDNNDAREGGF